MNHEFGSACVTGGAGFIGSHLVRELLDLGVKVTVVDDLSTGKRSNLPDYVDLVVGNICDPSVASVVADSEVVFHLAARVAIRSSFEFITEDITTNVLGTAELLKAVTQSTKVKKFIMASSMAVYADSDIPVSISEDYTTAPVSPYGISKLAAEQLTMCMCGASAVDSVVLRLFNTYGVGQALSPYVGVVTIFTNHFLSGKTPVIFGDGEQCRDFVNVNDVVQAFIGAMKYAPSGSTYNVGSGQGVTVNQVFNEICKAFAIDAKPDWVEPVVGELRYSIADISRARAELRYEPKYQFVESIAEVVHQIKVV
jgi:UDP-glucose 4-epimerase